MQVTVIVPTYCRVNDLHRCLKALTLQTYLPSEVLVIVQERDQATWDYLNANRFKAYPLHTVTVSQPGQVAALNAGLGQAQGDIIAITDDDAAPHRDWLERIVSHFVVDERVGGVGGRDWAYVGGILQDASTHPGASNIVGKVQWFGRTIGNHHIASGQAQEVEILKGVNMSYRRTAVEGLQFDVSLLGSGAQVHNDMGFSLDVKKQGWKLIYDPAVAVDHYLGERFDEDQRGRFNSVAQHNVSHNETIVLLDYLPGLRKLVYLVWAILVGTRWSPGVVQMLRFWPTQKMLSWQRGVASLRGRLSGVKTWFVVSGS